MGYYIEEFKYSLTISKLELIFKSCVTHKTIERCEQYIDWIDKYFSKKGLELLYNAMDKNKVKTVRILKSIPTINLEQIKLELSNLRDLFSDFKKEMKHSGVKCELRVMTEQSLSRQIHDTRLLSANVKYNVPSTDVAARGQYSEVKTTENSIPFEEFWERSYDINNDWKTIDEAFKNISTKNLSQKV